MAKKSRSSDWAGDKPSKPVMPSQPYGDFELQVGMQIPQPSDQQPASASPPPPLEPANTQEPTMASEQEDRGPIPPTCGQMENGSADAAERVRQRTQESVAYYAARLDEVEHRLDELEREWDIDRTLEANAATVALGGLALAIIGGRKWLLLPIAAVAFLLQHAAQGWCAPADWLHQMGVRTKSEIDEERYALKALRGDFLNIKTEGDCVSRAQRILDAVRMDGHGW